MRGARLRIISLVILVIGLSAAALVYWTGTAPEDYSDDPSTARAYKTDVRNVEINFGKLGVLTSEFMEEIKHPGVQAGIILAVASALSAGCFYFSRMIERRPPAADGQVELG